MAPVVSLSQDRAGRVDAVVIERGTCRVLFIYDIGLSVDLPAAEQLITSLTQRERIKRTRRAPQYFAFDPPPLRVPHPGRRIELSGFASEEEVSLVLYDFGAVSVSYAMPLAGPLSGLLELSDVLYDNAELRADSRRHVDELLATVHPAVRRPCVADFFEDYAIYEIESLSGGLRPDELQREAAAPLAQILRGETEPLSEQEVADALSCRVSFGRNDAAFIDWSAALLIDTEPDDVRTVLEYANVELLEMRHLDDRLDDALDEAARLLARRRWSLPLALSPTTRALRRIAEYQMDSALLFEDVNNTLKLLGDQYLARVYRAAAQRLHLADWDASILRKLQTLESTYQKIADHRTQLRMELLEWIIIALIAVSIALPLLARSAGH
jgi:hypothetical protein